MREDPEVFKIFQEHGIILTGHFEFVAGRHGDKYINHWAIFQNPRISRKLSLMLAARFKQDANAGLFDIVISPNAVLAHEVAKHLTFQCGRVMVPLTALKYCEDCRERGFYFDQDTAEKIKNKRALFVDDVGNDGFTARTIISAANEAGGSVVGMGYICNRGKLTQEHFSGVEHFEVLLDFPLESWDPQNGECRLCIENKVPLSTRFGHGRRKK